MATGEDLPEPDSGLTAAAHAVASWARARRATWDALPALREGTPAGAAGAPTARTEAPPRIDAPRPVQPPPRRIEPPSIASPGPTEPPRAPNRLFVEPIATPIAPARTPAAPSRAADGVRGQIWIAERAPAAWPRRVVGFAAAAAVIVAGVFGVHYLRTRPATEAVAPRPAPSPPAPAARRIGRLHVESTPPGARVLVDGSDRGVTPLTLDGVGVGRHTVVLESGDGRIARSVIVGAGETAEVNEAVYAGWVTISAPFDVTVSENGRVLSADERNQIMLGPGSHNLLIRNGRLEFENVRAVDVSPGQVTMVDVTPAPSSITVTASEPAEVWIDGTRAGATPLTGFALALGTHDVSVRRAAGGERRLSVTVTTRPASINVDFSKPGA